MKKKKRGLTKRQIQAKYRIVGKVDLDSKLTRKELEKYVRTATQLVNISSKTMNKASRKDFEKAIRVLGAGRAKGSLGIGITKTIKGKRVTKKKTELEAQAKILRSLLQGDTTSLVSKSFDDLKKERAYQTFRKSPFGFELSREEYDEFLQLSNKLSDLISNYGSSFITSIIENYRDRVSITTIGDIVREEYDGLSKGMNVSSFAKLVVDRIKEEIS